MPEIIRWGILGAGGIARKFATGLAALPDAQLAAVGSRTGESADKFGDEFSIPRRHASYEALAADPDIDAIYIATPHPYHAENTHLCLDHGKAVLVEKPFALNAHQAQAMIAHAREKGLFLMEAMWTRFLPVIVRVRQLLAEGAIGDVRWLQADFGFRTSFNPKGRLFDPALGGGALLDVGIYPVSLAYMILGAPQGIVSQVEIGESGVDDQNAIVFSYAGGQLALLSSATRSDTPQEAVIVGTEGRIRIHSPWWNAAEITVQRADKSVETIAPPRVGNGYNYEAAEVANCLRAGKLESDVISLDESLTIIGTLDTIRTQWGLKYPGE
jgi:predicted dehydrogenase